MKRRIMISFCFAVMICLSASVSFADYLRINRQSQIKEQPDKNSVTIEKVSPGTQLELLDEGKQANGYYHVTTVSPGRNGYIYRTMARPYSGNMTEPTVSGTEEISNPLSDPTSRITKEQAGYAARHLRIGKPQAVYERIREGYVTAQSAMLKDPLWVQYELRFDELNGPAKREGLDYENDLSIPVKSRADKDDYCAPYDHGHMAPAKDMTRSEKVMEECFLMSNMVPQVGVGFNQKIWKKLEIAVRKWVEQKGTLTIITGPVFVPDGNHVSYQVIGENAVAVPTHFFKIVVDARDMNNVDALAFLMPNKDLGNADYKNYLTSIRKIEQLTGLDFLSALPKTVQDRVESKTAAEIW